MVATPTSPDAALMLAEEAAARARLAEIVRSRKAAGIRAPKNTAKQRAITALRGTAMVVRNTIQDTLPDGVQIARFILDCDVVDGQVVIGRASVRLYNPDKPARVVSPEQVERMKTARRLQIAANKGDEKAARDLEKLRARITKEREAKKNAKASASA